MPIAFATLHDIADLVMLINSAYRGDASKSGWTTEADLIKGEIRTDEEDLRELMQKTGAVFLKYTSADNKIEGCVFLQQAGARMYLGMLSVSPLSQAGGIGKQLMNQAIEFAKQNRCVSIYMRVISLRHELIAWYEKQGFTKNGQREDFPRDNRFGTPVLPLEFLILEKQL